MSGGKKRAAAGGGSSKAAGGAEERPRILLIVGSLRKLSFNRQMALYVQTLLEDRAATEILDWKAVPIFDQDEEFPTPPAVVRARKAVVQADGLWIFTPEYNHGVPGGLKNLLDWLSRPAEDGTPGALDGKVATVSGVGGSGCVRHCFAALLPTMDFLRLDVPAATFTGASFNRAMVTSDRLALNDGLKASLGNQADALLARL